MTPGGGVRLHAAGGVDGQVRECQWGIGRGIANGEREGFGAGTESLLQVAVHITGSAAAGNGTIGAEINLVRSGVQLATGECERIADGWAAGHGYTVDIVDGEARETGCQFGSARLRRAAFVFQHGVGAVSRGGAGSRSALPGQGAVHGDSRGRLGSGTGKNQILIRGGLNRLSRAGINHGRIGPVRGKSA